MNHSIGTISSIIAITMLTSAAVIDIRTHRIPDRLVLAGALAGLLFLLFDAQRGLVNGLIGGITSGLSMLLVHKITRDGLGLGDVKLLGCTGIYLGLEGILSAMATAVVLSGLYSLILICISRDNKKREIPFAPFILVGALGAILF